MQGAFPAMVLAAMLAVSGAEAGGFDSEAVSGDLSAYQLVYVTPVTVALEDVRGRYSPSGFGERAVSPSDAARKAGDLREALSEALARDFTLAAGPGAGVLTVAATLTKLRSSRPSIADYGANPGLSFESVYAGGAAVRIEFSEEGRALGSVADDYDTSLGDGRPRIGTWDDADRAFASWARRLPELIRKR
ncbi:MAG: DUF3313 family protein [Parvularculaceae bacterium]|nr:DUF3313 family protein [Parvularculaceae bacterium]